MSRIDVDTGMMLFVSYLWKALLQVLSIQISILLARENVERWVSAVNLPANMLASYVSSPDCTIRNIIENDLAEIKVKAFLQVISE